MPLYRALVELKILKLSDAADDKTSVPASEQRLTTLAAVTALRTAVQVWREPGMRKDIVLS